MKAAKAGQHATLAIQDVQDSEAAVGESTDSHNLPVSSNGQAGMDSFDRISGQPGVKFAGLQGSFPEASRPIDVCQQISGLHRCDARQTTVDDKSSPDRVEESRELAKKSGIQPEEASSSALKIGSKKGSLTDRRHDVWQCSDEAKQSRATNLARTRDASLEEVTSSASASHSGESDLGDSPRSTSLTDNVSLLAINLHLPNN